MTEKFQIGELPHGWEEVVEPAVRASHLPEGVRIEEMGRFIKAGQRAEDVVVVLTSSPNSVEQARDAYMLHAQEIVTMEFNVRSLTRSFNATRLGGPQE